MQIQTEIVQSQEKPPRKTAQKTKIPPLGAGIKRSPSEEVVYGEMLASARKLREKRSSRFAIADDTHFRDANLPSSHTLTEHDEEVPQKEMEPLPTTGTTQDGEASEKDLEASKTRRKHNFVSTLMKRHEKESTLLTGTDNRSWTCHVELFEEMAKAHGITNENELLRMIQWTLGPGPKMRWERFCDTPGASWFSFKEMMQATYNSEIVHARTRDAIMSVSLSAELAAENDGPLVSRHSRAVTRTANKILRLAKDLPAL